MVKFISLGSNCSVGYQIKKYLNQERFGFEWNRIYNLQKIIDIYKFIIINKNIDLSFFDDLQFIKTSNDFPDFDNPNETTSFIYKNNHIGFYHDFYGNINEENILNNNIHFIKEKYTKRLLRILNYIQKELIVFIHLQQNNKNNFEILKDFSIFLQDNNIYHHIIYITPYEINKEYQFITNYTYHKTNDWKIDDFQWETVFMLKQYRNFIAQDLKTNIDFSLPQPDLYHLLVNIQKLNLFHQCKIWKSNFNNKFLIKFNHHNLNQLNDIIKQNTLFNNCIVYNHNEENKKGYTCLTPTENIEIVFTYIPTNSTIIFNHLPDAFTQSNIPIANELYTYISDISNNKKIITYGRNCHHINEFIKKKYHDIDIFGYTPCPIVLQCISGNDYHLYNNIQQLNNAELLILSPGRNGFKDFDNLTVNEIIYVSCNNISFQKDIKNKYKIVNQKRFELFPNTDYYETVNYLVLANSFQE